MTVVPTILQGAWKRRWIKYEDGRFDDSSIVIWLQFKTEMVDVRLDSRLADLSGRSSLDDCDRDDLLRLATSDSSSGITTCTPILRDDAGLRTATAEWSSDPGIAFQPETSFPEPGVLKWNEDASIMMERAPSGAYLEQWNRVGGTDPSTAASTIDSRSDGSRVFRLGSLAVLVHDRRSVTPAKGPLVDQVANAADLTAARALVDCEFSLAQGVNDQFLVVASTHPWRIGEVLHVT